MDAKDWSLLYSLVDAIEERPEVASIWHILTSKEDILSSRELVVPEINKFTKLDNNSSI
jgi:hypothetical protein